MADELADRVLAHLRSQCAAMSDLLQRLARAESPSLDRAAVTPVLDLLTAELEQCGLSVRRYRGQVSGGLLCAVPARRQRRRPVQLLVGHCDTVWPVGTVRDMPVRADGDAVHGPGTFDMKGGLVQMIFALRAVRDLALSPPADCVAVPWKRQQTVRYPSGTGTKGDDS